MQKDIAGQSVLFPNLSRRPVVAKFDQRHGSSDGGAILLKACDERLGLTQRLANCVVDSRQPGKIEHTIGDLVPQNRHAIACGYLYGNDGARLAGAAALFSQPVFLRDLNIGPFQELRSANSPLKR